MTHTKHTDSVEATIEEFKREFPELHSLGQHSTNVVMDERDTRNIHDWLRKILTTLQATNSQQVEEAVREERERHAQTLSALATMWNQYCSSPTGHQFMCAGEEASEVLERYGLLSAIEGETSNAMYGNLKVDYPLSTSEAEQFFIEALTPNHQD